MKSLFYHYLIIMLFLWPSHISFGEESRPPAENEDINDYMSKILAPDENGHRCILDEDIVVYASKLYFETKYLDSIKILKKVHLDHDSIYWLWKNEIAICDAVVNLDKQNQKHKSFLKYITENSSYFIFDVKLKRYFPSTKRLQESRDIYPNNEFLPEMQIYYRNVEKMKQLKLKN
jgi:hypothetical protein